MSIRVSCRLGEPFSRAVGLSTVALELSDQASVQQALDALVAAYPALGSLLHGKVSSGQALPGLDLMDPGQALPLQTFVNNRPVSERDRSWYRLQEGDQLFVFLPTVGG